MATNALTVRSLKLRYARDMAIWFVVLVIGLAWWWFAVTPTPVAPSLMDIRTTGTTSGALCPGETLTYTVDLHVSAPGVYAVDISVWRVTPPATVVFSETRRFVVSQATNYTLQREWRIPTTHTDPTTNAPVAWLPGHYERRHAISTVSRATIPSIVIVPFEIAQGCKP